MLAFNLASLRRIPTLIVPESGGGQEGQAGDGGVTMESGERSVEFHKWLELVTDMIATPGDQREEGG